MPRKTATLPKRPPTMALWGKIQKELRNGQFSQALTLAREFHALNPTDASSGAIRDALAGLIDQLLRHDKLSEARQHIDEAERAGEQTPAWLEQLIVFRARSGDWQGARRLIDRVPGCTVTAKALGFLVDRALRDPKNGKALLPPDLHAGFDAIIMAFAQYERGDDEGARNSLQAIGMQSPILDWKLLLRGLIAYSTSDDARMLENWQRLDATRLPAQIAAPLRFQLDPAYRSTLPPDQAKRIADRADRVALPMLASLRKVQRLLSSPETLPEALRQVRSQIGMLKMNAPQLLPKLANCFYWLIIMGGHPDDMEEYEGIFGKPADDPSFCRMIAMATESRGSFEEAHKEWGQYVNWIAAKSQQFPGEFGKRARAMIFLRMGDNALENERVPDESDPENFLDFLRLELHGRMKKKPLKPSAEACYHNAMELAPDWKEPLGRLLDMYAEQKQWEKAEAIGKKLVERFPDNSEALVDLAEILHHQEKDAEALDVLRKALQHNPLDNVLRTMVSQLTMRHGQELTLSGDFDAARAAFQESMALGPEFGNRTTKASWAACEFKAGNPEVARRLVAEVNEMPNGRVASAMLLTAETTRVKAGKAVQAEFKAQFEIALKGEMTFKELVQLLVAFNSYQSEEDRYYGFGTHEKKIIAKVQEAVERSLPEPELANFGLLLAELRLSKPLKLLADQGRSRFPDNPAFRLFQAVQTILQRPRSFDPFRAGYSIALGLEQLGDKDDPLSAALRQMVDNFCEEHPRLREAIERQRDFLRSMPNKDYRRFP